MLSTSAVAQKAVCGTKSQDAGSNPVGARSDVVRVSERPCRVRWEVAVHLRSEVRHKFLGDLGRRLDPAERQPGRFDCVVFHGGSLVRTPCKAGRLWWQAAGTWSASVVRSTRRDLCASHVPVGSGFDSSSLPGGMFHLAVQGSHPSAQAKRDVVMCGESFSPASHERSTFGRLGP